METDRNFSDLEFDLPGDIRDAVLASSRHDLELAGDYSRLREKALQMKSFGDFVVPEQGPDIIIDHCVLMYDGQPYISVRGDYIPFTKQGFRRVARSLGMPVAVVDFLTSTGRTEDCVRYLNEDSVDKSRVLRTTKDRRARALVSDKYTFLDDWRLVDLVKECVPDALVAFDKIDPDGSSSVQIFLPDRMKATDWTDLGVGLTLRNSEVGELSAQVLPYVFSTVCLNGQIYGKSSSSAVFRQIHAGDFDLAELRRSLKAVIEAGLGHAELLLEAMVSSRQIAVKHPEKLILEIGRAMNLSLMTIKEARRNLDFEMRLQDSTAGAIVGAFTRAAKTAPDRTDIEAVAGKLLLPGIYHDMRMLMESWGDWDARASKISDSEADKVFQYVRV